MFAILSVALLIESQEEIHCLAGWEGRGLMGTTFVNKHFVSKLAFPNNIRLDVPQQSGKFQSYLTNRYASFSSRGCDFMPDNV